MTKYTTSELIETAISAAHRGDAQVFASAAVAAGLMDLAAAMRETQVTTAPAFKVVDFNAPAPVVRLAPTNDQIANLLDRLSKDYSYTPSTVREWLKEITS